MAASAFTGVWARQLTGPEVLRIVTTDGIRLWTSTSTGKTQYSTNGGQNWTTVQAADVTSVLRGLAFADNLNGWAVGEGNNAGVIVHTTDGGVTWQRQNDGTGQRMFGVAALSPQVVMAVGGGTMFTVARRSTDGGATWATMPVPLNDGIFLDIYFYNSMIGWITGLDGGIAKTTDGGLTWTAQSHPANWGLLRISFADANNGWAGGYYGVLLHTTNGGQTWVQQPLGLPDFTHVLSVSAVSPTIAWISGYGGGAQSRPYVWQTTNGGASWINQTPSVGPYDSFPEVRFLSADEGWAGNYTGIFKHTSNNPPPAATLTGHVTWQGRPAQPDPGQQLPLTVTLRSGATEYNYATTTDANGSYSLNVTSLPDGAYTWRVKGPKYLANAGSLTLARGGNNAEMGLMVVGDTNNDNVVNVADFNIIKGSFGKAQGDPGYDDRAEFTGDSRVNVLDFNLMKLSFGQAGAP
jgi:photosystem II stability/assembly factor-like uncharacterized protein